MIDYINMALKNAIKVKEETLGESKDKIIDSVNLIVETFNNQKKLLVCGNGGSASDSLHICGEFTNRLLMERKPLPALCLNADLASLTAISNDYSFDIVFSKQLEAFGERGDLLWVLSTSGNSKNIIEVAKKAGSMGIKVLSFSGGNGGQIVSLSDICIVVNEKVCSRVQEVHSFLYHVIIELVEKKMFGDL